MANVYVYIDGFNLYYGAVKDSPYRWLDLGALCAHMLPMTKCNLSSILPPLYMAGALAGNGLGFKTHCPEWLDRS